MPVVSPTFQAESVQPFLKIVENLPARGLLSDKPIVVVPKAGVSDKNAISGGISLSREFYDTPVTIVFPDVRLTVKGDRQKSPKEYLEQLKGARAQQAAVYVPELTV